MQEFIKYAPMILIFIMFGVQYKIFVTPEQLRQALEKKENDCSNDCKEHYVTKSEMQTERKSLIDEVRREFLEKVAFEQFTKRLDDKFEYLGQSMQTIIENQEFMKDVLFKKGGK
jgi:hypothetical protein